MNEAEWLACDDPRRLLRFANGPGLGPNGLIDPARSPYRGRGVGDRKLRLVAIAIARDGGCGSWASVGHLIEGAESMADGGHHGLTTQQVRLAEEYAAVWLIGVEPEEVLKLVLDHYGPGVPGVTRARQAAIVRDIIGNPFRERVSGNPWGRLLCEASPLIAGVAAACYENRLPGGLLDPQRFAVLSDALEEFGWEDESLLMHLRGSRRCPRCVRSPGRQVGAEDSPCLDCRGGWQQAGQRYRGFWPLDLVLGKE